MWKRYVAAVVVSFIPIANLIPVETIFILLAHYREKKVVKAFNRALEESRDAFKKSDYGEVDRQMVAHGAAYAGEYAKSKMRPSSTSYKNDRERNAEEELRDPNGGMTGTRSTSYRDVGGAPRPQEPRGERNTGYGGAVRDTGMETLGDEKNADELAPRSNDYADTGGDIPDISNNEDFFNKKDGNEFS